MARIKDLNELLTILDTHELAISTGPSDDRASLLTLANYVLSKSPETSASGYNEETILDLSGPVAAESLNTFFTQDDGWLESWTWHSGDGTNQLAFSGGSGKTIGGVAIASILPDIVGDGQGRLTLRKEGNNARLVDYYDADGGNFLVTGEYKDVSFIKDVKGTVMQTATEEFAESTNVASGVLFRTDPEQSLQDYPVEMKMYSSSCLFLFEADTAACWIVSKQLDASYNKLTNWRAYAIMRSATGSFQNFKVSKTAHGRWTTTHPIIG